MEAMDAFVRGTRIAYDDEGSGPLVVRLHGLTASRAATAKGLSATTGNPRTSP